MNLLTSVLIFLLVSGFVVIFWLWYSRRLDFEEKKLIKFLKKHGGEVNPRWVKDDLGVSRAWLERVSSRLEAKGKVVRWGWRAKSLICLKGAVVGNEKLVVALLKKNGGKMRQSEVASRLGFDKESFYWRMVRKMEAKKVVFRRTKGRENFLVLVGRLRLAVASKGEVKLSKKEKRLVRILRKAGGEMRDVSLEVRMAGASDVIESLGEKGVVFRWGVKRRNVCLVGMFSGHEERLIGILEGNGGRMMWRDLVREMGYSGKGFHRVLDKLEKKGGIFRRKVGRSVEVVLS